MSHSPFQGISLGLYYSGLMLGQAAEHSHFPTRISAAAEWLALSFACYFMLIFMLLNSLRAILFNFVVIHRNSTNHQ